MYSSLDLLWDADRGVCCEYGFQAEAIKRNWHEIPKKSSIWKTSEIIIVSLAATRIESNGIAQCCHFHLIRRGEGLLYLSILCCADFHFIDLTLNVLEKCWTIMGAGNHCADYFNSVWWAMVSAVGWCRVQRHMSSEIKFISMKQFSVCLAGIFALDFSFSYARKNIISCIAKIKFP